MVVGIIIEVTLIFTLWSSETCSTGQALSLKGKRGVLLGDGRSDGR
jgi:hypothetical protein